MKFVADVNIEKQIIDRLRVNGHDVVWIANIDCEMEDPDILRIANEDIRVLITNDKDFGELVFRQRLVSSGVLLLRLEDLDGNQKVQKVLDLLKTDGNRIENHFVVLTLIKTRFVKL